MKFTDVIVKFVGWKHSMLVLTICTAITLWFLDAAYDTLTHHKLTFWQSAITEVPKDDIGARGLAIIGVLAWGYIMNRFCCRRGV